MQMTSATIMLNQEKTAKKLLYTIEGNIIPQRKKDEAGIVPHFVLTISTHYNIL